MLVKFHARGKGGGEGPVEYLIGKDGKRDLAKVLRGNPQDTIDLINSSKNKHKYTSGVLSFAEGDDLTEKQKIELMNSFEESLLPGLEADQYSCFWVEHRDKGRLELNFVVPSLELRSGNKLQAYYDPVDRRRVNAWAQVKRIELNLADPNEPERKQILNISKDLPKERKKIPEAITNGLLGLIEQGEIKNRVDIVKKLNESGLKVVRETKSSISIADVDGGQNIRLKGWIYERDVRFSADVRAEIKARGANYRASHSERLEQSRAELARAIEHKKSELIKRYGAKRFRVAEASQEEQSDNNKYSSKQMALNNDGWNINSDSDIRDDVVVNSQISGYSRRSNVSEISISGSQRNYKNRDSGIQIAQRGSNREDRRHNNYLCGSKIYESNGSSDKSWRQQGEEIFSSEVSSYQRKDKRSFKEEEINDRNRTITLRELTDDRSQSARIIEQIFRRFDAGIQGIKQSLVSSFKRLSAAITTRDTSTRSLIARSKELRKQNRELEERDKQVRKFNEQRHEYLKYRGSEVSGLNEWLNEANKSVIRISQSIIYIKNLAQERAKQEQLRAEQAAREAALAAEKARHAEEARLRQLEVLKWQYAKEFKILANNLSWDYRNKTQKWNSLEQPLKNFLSNLFETHYDKRDEFLFKNFEQITPNFVEQLTQKVNERSRGRSR